MWIGVVTGVRHTSEMQGGRGGGAGGAPGGVWGPSKHLKHCSHVCDLGRVEAQRLIERHRVLPSQKRMRAGVSVREARDRAWDG